MELSFHLIQLKLRGQNGQHERVIIFWTIRIILVAILMIVHCIHRMFSSKKREIIYHRIEVLNLTQKQPLVTNKHNTVAAFRRKYNSFY